MGVRVGCYPVSDELLRKMHSWPLARVYKCKACDRTAVEEPKGDRRLGCINCKELSNNPSAHFYDCTKQKSHATF